MKLAISGSREIPETKGNRHFIEEVIALYRPEEVLSGAAKEGVDQIVKNAALPEGSMCFGFDVSTDCIKRPDVNRKDELEQKNPRTLEEQEELDAMKETSRKAARIADRVEEIAEELGFKPDRSHRIISVHFD